MVFTKYRRRQLTELRPYQPGESLFGVSIRTVDREAGHPVAGDMIARNPLAHAEQWLVPRLEFEETYEPVPTLEAAWRFAREGPPMAAPSDVARVYPLVCHQCGRPAVAGEKLGETCGAPVLPPVRTPLGLDRGLCAGLLVHAAEATEK